MKILFVLHHNYRNSGGVAGRVRFLKKELERIGHKIGIVYPQYGILPSLTKVENDYIIKHPFYEKNIPVLPFLDKYMKSVLSEGWDIIHFHHIKNLSLSFFKLSNIRKIYTLHDYYLVCPLVQRYNPLRNCDNRCELCYASKKRFSPSLFPHYHIYKNWQKLSSNYSQYINLFIAPSNYIKNIVKQGKTVYLPFNCENKKVKKNSKGKYVVAFFGGSSFIKGAKVFLSLIEKMKNDSNVEFRIYGKVKDREIPPKYVMGYFREEEKDRVFSEIDLVVMPSLWEEVAPYLIYECRMYGVPVIATSIGGIKELLPKENLFKYPPNVLDIIELIKRGMSGKIKSIDCGDLPNSNTFISRLMELYNGLEI